MTPRTDDYEHDIDNDNDNLSATATDDDDDDDDGLKEDMAALARACMISAPRNDDVADNVKDDDETPTQEDPLLAAGDALVPVSVVAEDSDSDSDSEQSDLECLKRVQSLYQPPDSLPTMATTAPATTTASDSGDEDDFETVRAIFKRFSAYDGGRSLCIRCR